MSIYADMSCLNKIENKLNITIDFNKKYFEMFQNITDIYNNINKNLVEFRTIMSNQSIHQRIKLNKANKAILSINTMKLREHKLLLPKISSFKLKPIPVTHTNSNYSENEVLNCSIINRDRNLSLNKKLRFSYGNNSIINTSDYCKEKNMSAKKYHKKIRLII